MIKITSFILLLALTLFAKDGSGPFAKIGCTYSNLTFSDTANFGDFVKADTGKVTPTFLIGGEYEFGRVVSITGAFGMEFLGATFDSVSYDFTFITLPLDLKLTIPIKEGGITFLLGPRFNFMTSADRSDTPQNDDKTLFETYNFAFGFGLGGEIPIKSHAILLESSYSAGISDILYGMDEMSTGVMGVTVGFRY